MFMPACGKHMTEIDFYEAALFLGTGQKLGHMLGNSCLSTHPGDTIATLAFIWSPCVMMN